MSEGIKWLLICAALASGEAAGFALSRYASLWPLAVLAAVGTALGGFGLALRGWKLAVAFLSGLALALAVASGRTHVLEEATVLSAGRPYRVEISVDSPPRTTRGKNGVCWASFASRLGSVRLRVVLPVASAAEAPREGEIWACAGWLQRLDEDEVRKVRTFFVKGAGTSARRVRASDPGSFAARLGAVRRNLSRRMGIGLDRAPDVADLNRAILLGERRRISPEDHDAFVSAGTLHIVSISGLHVMIIARLLAVFLSLTGLPYRLQGPCLAPVLWFYVFVTGGSPSAVRAAAMATLQTCAPLAWRRPDGLVAWSLTFLAVHLRDPFLLLDVGCRLSFVVMLGLILWGNLVSRYVRNPIAATLGMTLAAWSVGVPIVAQVFGRVTPGGLLANLALIPAAGYSLGASFVGLVASFASEPLAAHVNNFAALFTSAMVGISHAVASIPGSDVAVVPWSFAASLGWYVAEGLLLWLLHSVLSRRLRRL